MKVLVALLLHFLVISGVLGSTSPRRLKPLDHEKPWKSIDVARGEQQYRLSGATGWEEQTIEGFGTFLRVELQITLENLNAKLSEADRPQWFLAIPTALHSPADQLYDYVIIEGTLEMGEEAGVPFTRQKVTYKQARNP